jgi:DNA polymerase (family 10)
MAVFKKLEMMNNPTIMLVNNVHYLLRLKTGMDADIRVLKEESFGAALQYFTGSKDHNIVLRKIAQEKDWKLSEYGLFRGSEQIASKTEEEVYKKLGLQWIPPEIRENTGEIEAA